MITIYVLHAGASARCNSFSRSSTFCYVILFYTILIYSILLFFLFYRWMLHESSLYIFCYSYYRHPFHPLFPGSLCDKAFHTLNLSQNSLFWCQYFILLPSWCRAHVVSIQNKRSSRHFHKFNFRFSSHHFWNVLQNFCGFLCISWPSS